MATNDTIARPSLGRTAQIGDLYDTINDKLIMVNIFKRDLPNGAIKRIENPQHNSEFFFSSKVSEKLHKLNVQGEVSLSVLFGIISVEGSAAYLNEKKNSSHDVQCSFVQKIRTISERVNLFDEELKACFGSDFGKGTSATHVVVGIEWGANATVTLTHASSKDVEKKEVEGRLKLALKKFSVGGEGKEPSANSSDNLFEELHMKVHADIMPNHEGAPRNVNEALEFIYNMPKRVADTNGGMGRQLEFHLLPISVLAELIQFFTNLNHIIHTIEIGEVKKFEQVFDQIDEYQEKLNDLLIVMNANKAILTKAVQDKVHDYRNDFEATVATFKADLAKKLCEVRGGEAELPELAYMRLEFQKHSTASPTKVSKFLDECTPIQEKIYLVHSLEKENVTMITNASQLVTAKHDHRKNNLHVLFFSFDCNQSNPNWGDNINLFLRMASAKQEQEHFLAVDTDVLTKVQNAEKIPKGVCICLIFDGKYILKDVLKEQRKLASQCTVDCSIALRSLQMPNAKCVPLELPCPKATPRGHCAKEKHEWICVNCHTIVEYNNNKIYCQCGYEHMQHFRYKCNHEMHGDGHIAFELDELQNLVNKIRPYEEINIVVLGETGVGKSTWINAIANYISHESIDTALEGELINLIPTKFQLTIKNGENLRRVEVKVGESENESFHENQSSTQIPRSYVFTNNQKLYRIIDTPGIGDTRGIEQDKQNIQSILSFLAQYDEIHAICILMMPNQSRLTPTFEFCFKELIMQFHRSAAQNIVFCFTNTSGSNFCVGETHGPLESLTNAIKSVQRVDIPLTSHTMYAFDNMAYRYLCTKIQENFLFPPDLEDLYRQSFIVSRKETLRLFEYVKDLPPHNAKDSLSLNYARKVIIGLTGPLTMISSAVGQTLEKIKEREKEIEEHKNNEQELLKILKRKIPITRYKMTKEDTVFCKTCSVQKSYYGEQRTPYYEADPTVMDKNPFKIWTCNSKMTKKEDSTWECSVCGPDFPSVQTGKTFTSFTEEVEEEDKTVRSHLDDKKNIVSQIQQRLKAYKDFQCEIQHEHDEIVKASANFAHFLRHHSITTYNDATERYLKTLIKCEEEKGNSSKLASYKKLLKRYLKERSIIERAMRENTTSDSTISTLDVITIANQLTKLNYYGKDIDDAIISVQKTPQHLQLDELYFNPKTNTKKGFGRKAQNQSYATGTDWYYRILSWLPKSQNMHFRFNTVETG